MRRRIQLLISGLALTAAVGCGETVSAPASDSLGYLQGEPAFARSGPITQSVTIPSGGGLVTVGPFVVDFPANAVCDPATSGYGPGTWDLPCNTLNSDYTLQATFVFANRRLWVDFDADIRFDPSKTVTISTQAIPIRNVQKAYRRNPNSFRFLTILYHTSIGNRPINDAAGNASLVTKYDFSTNTISRRILHFSGYHVIYGYACTPSPEDPYCVPGETPQE